MLLMIYFKLRMTDIAKICCMLGTNNSCILTFHSNVILIFMGKFYINRIITVEIITCNSLSFWSFCCCFHLVLFLKEDKLNNFFGKI